jgi:hypothetical protein
MTSYYEFVHSHGPAAVRLIFLANYWDRLPPEIRFSRAWYDSAYKVSNEPNAAQRLHIARQGFILVERQQETSGRPA